MVIRNIVLHKIGKFNSFEQEKDFVYQADKNCNIIFGFNGAGKTILSNALSLYEKESFLSNAEKSSLFEDIKQDDNSFVLIKSQDGQSFKYSNNIYDKPIYVFNSYFVITHIFDGTKGNMKKFAKVGGEIKNPELDKIEAKIRELENIKIQAEKENKEMDQLLKSITQKWSNDFGKRVTDKNKSISRPDLKEASDQIVETQEKLNIEIEELFGKYDLSKRNADLVADVEELKKLQFNEHNINRSLLCETLNKSPKQLSKEILERKIRYVQKHLENSNNVETWFKTGKDILHGISKEQIISCPICGANISSKIDNLLKDFDGYFDNQYELFISDIKENANKLRRYIDQISQEEKDEKALEKILIKYKQQLAEYELQSFNFADIKQELQSILGKYNEKLANPQRINFAISPSFDNVLSGANIAIQQMKKIREAILKKLTDEIPETHKIEDDIRHVYRRIILSEFNDYKEGVGIKRYKANLNKIFEININNQNDQNGLLYWQNALRLELQKIKTESKGISKFLQAMGIDNFIVDINENNPNENIVIKYKSLNTDKIGLKNSLSDGEKTALAFAYFLSKFENEVSTESEKEKSIVIVDDPISSLDENRLYNTAYLINNMFQNVKQLLVFSHNFMFLKFFNSLYRRNCRECYFLYGNKISDLPEELQNFETPYFYMLKHIIDYASKESTDYENAKKYLPNFVRRVLETFLSFKLAYNNVQGRSPGLKEFCDSDLKPLQMEASIKTELLEEIQYIKKLTDPHSHGNAMLAEESFYISDSELKDLVTKTLEVIRKLDSVHIECVISHLSKYDKTFRANTDFNPLS